MQTRRIGLKTGLVENDSVCLVSKGELAAFGVGRCVAVKAR